MYMYDIYIYDRFVWAPYRAKSRPRCSRATRDFDFVFDVFASLVVSRGAHALHRKLFCFSRDAK